MLSGLHAVCFALTQLLLRFCPFGGGGGISSARLGGALWARAGGDTCWVFHLDPKFRERHRHWSSMLGKAVKPLARFQPLLSDSFPSEKPIKPPRSIPRSPPGLRPPPPNAT